MLDDLEDLFDDDDDDELYEYVRSDYDDWYDNHTGFLLKEKGKWECWPDTDMYPFYYNVYKKAMQDYRREARRVLYTLYPVMNRLVRPRILERMDADFYRVGDTFLMFFFQLLMHLKYGYNLREVYENFDKMEKSFDERGTFTPYPFDYEKSAPWLTSEQRQQLEEESYREEKKAFDWKYGREKMFTDMLVNVLVQYYPSLSDFDKDTWVVFYSLLINEYYQFEFTFDHYICAAKYDMTEEETFLPYKEFMEVLSRKVGEKMEKKKLSQM